MLRQTMALPSINNEILIMDSISLATESDRNRIVVSGSHGGVPSAEYAIRGKLQGVFFNDAGIGKDGAGIKGLEMLDAALIMAATADCNTSRIGDAIDVYENGIISSVNIQASNKGIKVGLSVKAAVLIMISSTEA